MLEFMECDTCRAKVGSPVLCAGCVNNRRLINNIQGRYGDIAFIRGKLTNDFPELAYCGAAYTIKMLDDDLNRVLSLMDKSPRL